jgi:hypothetical protein
MANGGSLIRGAAAGASYAGIAANSEGGSSAAILAGTNLSGDDSAVSMSWRATTIAELSGETRPRSDVLQLSGMQNFEGSAQADPFVLSMSYELTGPWTPALGWLDGDTWKSAIAGNFGGTPTFVDGAFVDGGIAGLSDDVGHYGIDKATHTVWAVVNHNSSFAVVPEPSTLAMLGVAALGLLLAMRRRRAAC